MQQQDKKQIYIGPTIQHIQNAQFLIKNNQNILLLNKRQIQLLNTQTQSITTSKIDTERVSSCTYHEQLNIYLIKTQHDIFIINQLGESLGKINLPNQQIALMESRFIFILRMQDGADKDDPHIRKDKLIYITDENLHISQIKIEFERAILKHKVINRFGFVLEKNNINKKSAGQIDPTIIFDAPEWIEKCKIFKQLGYFVCYNKNQIMVFRLPKLRQQTLQHYLTYVKKTSSKKTSQQNMITDVVISYRQKQIIFSYSSGIIKIYRFNQSKKYLQQLKGHQKQCYSLFISNKNNKDILYSCGSDNTVRIWNLYQFQEIYSLRIDLVCDSAILLSDELAFVKFNNFRRTSLCKINAYKMEPVMGENKQGKITSLKCDSQWGIVLYSNNYAEMFLISEQVHNEPNKGLSIDPMQQINGNKLKNYIQKIQFPLKYGNVISAKKLKKNQYAIILQKGFSMITLDKDQIISQNFELKKLVYNQQISHMHEISDSEQQEQQMDQYYNVHEEKEKIKDKSKGKQNNKQYKEEESLLENNNSQKEKKGQNSQQNNRLVQLIHEKLLGTYLFSIVEDWKGIPTALTVSFVTFVVGKRVPMWDMDQKKKVVQATNNPNQSINQEKTRKRKKSLIPIDEQKKESQLIHVVLGTQKGVIYIINIQNRSQFQSRVIMHSGSVKFIQQFFPKNYSPNNKQSNELFFLSYDQSKQICLWSLSEDSPPNTYCRVSNRLDITHLSLHQSFMLIGQKEGKVSVLDIVYESQKNDDIMGNQELLSPYLKKKSSRASSRGSNINKKPANLVFKQSKNEGLYGHMKKVNTGDHIYYKHKNLFITGSQDCSIKLWLGIQKILLFQLKIFDTIQHIRFLRQGLDFMMAHHDQISLIKRKNIQQIMQIDHDLDKKYSNLPFVGQQTLEIKSFFNKQTQLFYSSIMKKQPFRLKNKKSINIQLTNHQIDISSYNNQSPRYSNQAFSLNGTGMIHAIPQQSHNNPPYDRQPQVNFLTKLLQKQQQHHPKNQQLHLDKSAQKYLSPPKKSEVRSIYDLHPLNQSKLKVYSKSEQKIKSKQKRTFHIINTSMSKQQNQTYFLLPKIMTKNKQSKSQMKKIANSPYASFKTSIFLQQLKHKKQKAFSYTGRYGR